MSHSRSSVGISEPSALFMIFLVLKLTGFIDWSWWWVTAPIWGAALFFLVALGVALLLQRFESPGAKAARAMRRYGDALSRRRR